MPSTSTLVQCLVTDHFPSVFWCHCLSCRRFRRIFVFPCHKRGYLTDPAKWNCIVELVFVNTDVDRSDRQCLTQTFRPHMLLVLAECCNTISSGCTAWERLPIYKTKWFATNSGQRHTLPLCFFLYCTCSLRNHAPNCFCGMLTIRWSYVRMVLERISACVYLVSALALPSVVGPRESRDNTTLKGFFCGTLCICVLNERVHRFHERFLSR